MFNTIVEAGAASRYVSGSDQMMRFRLRNTEMISMQFFVRLDTGTGTGILLWGRSSFDKPAR
jgi:hypothetical protein